jgi:S1-C subfamily serine protease
MGDGVQDLLTGMSNALAERARLARPSVVKISAQGHRARSGTLWRKDVVIAAEQGFPDVGEATVTLADGSTLAARIAGRDAATNVIALRLDGGPEVAPPPAAEPQPGTLVLAFGAAEEGVSVRLGVVHSVGSAWHSRAGGRIDRRIILDISLGHREEGGPVLDAGGGLLGMSTLGPRRSVLVIPSATVDGVIEPLLSTGRVERGWLGVALQPVLLPEALQTVAGQSRGLIIMGVSKDGPAARAKVQVGDILLSVGGESVARPITVAQRLGPDSVGQQIELRLIRAGTPQTLQATVGVRPPR